MRQDCLTDRGAMQGNRAAQITPEEILRGRIDVIDQNHFHFSLVENAKMHAGVDLPGKPLQNGLRFIAKIILLKCADAKAKHAEPKPVALRLRILFDVSAGAQRCQNAVDVARQQHSALGQIGHSERTILAEFMDDPAHFSDRGRGF